MPLDWKELKAICRKGDTALAFFGPEEALKRLKRKGDIFKPVLKLKQKLAKSHIEAIADVRAETLRKFEP
jgi:bifunctional non-homologous end joining protein LigD